MGGLLLAIVIAPGAMVVLLGLELLENRLLGSATAGTPNRAGSDLRNRQRGGPLTLAFVIELFPKVAEIRAYLR